MILFYSGDTVPPEVRRSATLGDMLQQHELHRASIDRALEAARPGLLESLLGLFRAQHNGLADVARSEHARRDLNLSREQIRHTLGYGLGAPEHHGGWF
jgi:hypothetical protein